MENLKKLKTINLVEELMNDAEDRCDRTKLKLKIKYDFNTIKFAEETHNSKGETNTKEISLEEAFKKWDLQGKNYRTLKNAVQELNREVSKETFTNFMKELQNLFDN